MNQQTNKIIIVGAFDEAGKTYTYASSFATSLSKLNYTVFPFNYRKAIIPFLHHQLCRPIQNAYLSRQLCSAVDAIEPDIIFFIKAETITTKMLVTLKKRSHARFLFFYPDSPFTLWNGNSNTNVIKNLSHYDHILSWSHELIPAFLSAGCKHVSYFPFAFDASLFQSPIILTDADHRLYDADVSFIGTWELERETWLSHVKTKLPSCNLAIWGNEWAHHIKPHHVLYSSLRGNAIYNTEMRKAFMCSKININLIRKQNIQAHNMRTMEIPAAQAFMLTQRTHEQAHMLFQENNNIACFASPEELIEKIHFFLSHEDERIRITQNSFIRVQQFTLDQQLAMLDALRI